MAPTEPKDLFDELRPPPPQPRPDPEFEAVERAFRANLRRRSRIVTATVVLLALAVIGLTHGERIRRSARRAWFGWQAWSSDAPLAGVDLDRLHGELLTNWVIARNEDEVSATQAAEAVAEALAPSPALSALFQTLHSLARPDPGLLRRNEELLDAVAAWNRLLATGDAPWWLEGNMLVGPGTAQFYLKTYRIRGTAVLRVGAERVVTRLLSRADQLNVIELALGHASPDRDQAALLMHRVRDHAMDVLWPALATTATTATTAGPSPGRVATREDRSLSGRVRAEVRGALTANEWQALNGTAAARGVLVTLRDRVAQRRRCGARLVLHMKKVHGPGRDTLRWLRGVAAEEAQFECAAITQSEVAQLATASRTLRGAGGLQAAVDRLVMWLARDVAVHEARHVADQRLHRGLERKLPCQGCPPRWSVRTQAEFSAWLAELAWGPAPFTTLLHACSLRQRTATGRALQLLLRRIGEAPCSQPPVDVQRRARLLELKILGREERIRFVSHLPDRMTRLERR